MEKHFSGQLTRDVADGRIEVDRGNGQWVFLDIDTESHYVDTLTLAPGTTAIWKYRALHLGGDQPFGQTSDTVQLAGQG